MMEMQLDLDDAEATILNDEKIKELFQISVRHVLTLADLKHVIGSEKIGP